MFDQWKFDRNVRVKAGLAVFWLFVCCVLMAWYCGGSVLGQITAPVPTTFTIRSETPKNFSFENVTGVPIKWAMLAADPDTIKEAWFQAVVDSVIDSTTVVLGVAMRYGNTSVNRSVTVRTNYDLWLPDEEWDDIPDSLFQIALNDTLRHVKNWSFKLQVKPLSDIKLPARATLIAGDSIKSDADTVTGLAVRADLGSLSFELTAAAADSDSCQVILAYQVKLRGGEWTGPSGSGSYYVASDSVVLVPGVPKKIPFAPPAAEWLRPALIGMSRTGNVRADSLVAEIK